VPSSVTIDPPLFLSGPTYQSSAWRNSDGAALAWNGASYAGVYQNANRLKVTATTGLNVTVDPGTAVMPSAAGTTDGAYRVRNSSTRTLTAGTADATNPRIDLVVIGVQDNGDSTSTGFVKIVPGTPAPSPSPPATPSNSVALARVRVNAGVTTITSVTDVRTFTIAPGGILPVASAAVAGALTGTDGQFAYDTANDRVMHMASAGVRQARMLPFAPVVAARTVNQTAASGESTLCSVSVATDGATDLELIAKVNGHFDSAGGGGGYQVAFRLYIGSNQVFAAVTDNRAADSVTRGGCGFTHITSSATGDTPSAGTHTVQLRWAPFNNGSDTIHITCDPDWPATLYVRPVPL
jgi:hypothetical protein